MFTRQISKVRDNGLILYREIDRLNLQNAETKLKTIKARAEEIVKAIKALEEKEDE